MTIKETIKKFIPQFALNVYHYKLALLGAFLFGFPGLLRSRASDGQGKDKSMKIIGVTGTSGKSTTVDFITRILDESHPSPKAPASTAKRGESAGEAGNKVASISSIRFKIADKEWENKYKMTMPGRFAIQKFLRQAKNAGCQYVVLEVTSEGIKQYRHKFINFDTVVFTNLGKEHIESHGGFENYRNAKLKLFKENQNTHVINADDENAKYFLDLPAKNKIIFSIKDEEAKKIKLNLLGEFNIYNALAAICVAQNYGVDFETCARALEKVKEIPGRMEIIQKEPFLVVVDYAHTPEQLESVYKTLTNMSFPRKRESTGREVALDSRFRGNDSAEENSKLICVLGSCGGGRDKWKRPVLGKIASQYCNEIIITNEDSYDESPMQIIEEVASGAGGISINPSNPYKSVSKILDRKEAIKKAVELAKPGDTVVITGKGSEPWMCVENGKKIPWDDRKIAKEACLPAGRR